MLPWIWFYAAVSGDKQSDCTGDCKKQLDNQSAVTFGLRRISDCIKDNWKSKLASVLQHIAIYGGLLLPGYHYHRTLARLKAEGKPMGWEGAGLR